MTGNSTTFTLDYVPATPPTPPEGYGPQIRYDVLQDGGNHWDAMDHAAWAARRLGNPDPRLDFSFAVRTWVDHGVETYDLFAEVECNTVDSDGEPGSFSATCSYDRQQINPDWGPWVNTGDMRTPAYTPEYMRAEGYTIVAQTTPLSADPAAPARNVPVAS